MILVGDWAPEQHPVELNTSFSGLFLGNLEAPILESGCQYAPSLKAGPNLSTLYLPQTGLEFAFSLANNHIMDYADSGLSTTIQALHQRGMKFGGAGDDIHAARQPLILDDGGISVGVICCCEAQFGVARAKSPGVAAYGPWVYRAIRALREEGLRVIVSVHLGVEDSPWPYPHQQELYRSYIDAGATVVHGHHAHVPQGYEEYGNGLILYGAGNFAVNPEKWHTYPNGLWSLGVEIDMSTERVSWRLLPFEVRHHPGVNGIRIEESNTIERNAHLDYLGKCTLPLSDVQLLNSFWHEVALRVYHHHAAGYMRFTESPPIAATRPVGRRIGLRRGLAMVRQALLNRLPAPTPPLQVTQYDYLLWHVMIACESHRQVLATALGILGGEIVDLRTSETKELADVMMPWSVDTP